LRERLVRAGIAPRRVRRLVFELEAPGLLALRLLTAREMYGYELARAIRESTRMNGTYLSRSGVSTRG